MKAASGPSFAATLNEGRQNSNDAKTEVSIWWELLKNAFGFSDFTRHALVYALIEKMVPDKESYFVKNHLRMRDELIERVNKMLASNAVLLMPSYPETAPKHGTTIPKISTVMAQDGLSLGVQIATAHLDDHLSLNMAVEVEKMFGGWVPPCPFINHVVVPPPLC